MVGYWWAVKGKNETALLNCIIIIMIINVQGSPKISVPSGQQGRRVLVDWSALIVNKQ